MTTINWQALRSDIYIRDKGICWICNTFVDLRDYDLGHLIDRCNGGHDDYDNLAVMHKTCNLAKPHHATLEEAMKWKLTATLPPRRQSDTRIAQPPTRKKHHLSPHIPKPLTAHQQAIYNEQVARIKPATIVWVQGRPQGGPMWRVFPPPYRQEDMFTMRQTPLGATDSGGRNINETLQVIGGELSKEVDIESGNMNIHISTINGISKLHCEPNLKANIGVRELTIGMGKGQIPIEEWRKARKQGISLDDFKKQWFNRTKHSLAYGISHILTPRTS